MNNNEYKIEIYDETKYKRSLSYKWYRLLEKLKLIDYPIYKNNHTSYKEGKITKYLRPVIWSTIIPILHLLHFVKLKYILWRDIPTESEMKDKGIYSCDKCGKSYEYEMFPPLTSKIYNYSYTTSLDHWGNCVSWEEKWFCKRCWNIYEFDNGDC